MCLALIMYGWLTSDAATHHYLNLSSPRSREMQAVPVEEWSEICTPASHMCLETGLNQLEESHGSGT